MELEFMPSEKGCTGTTKSLFVIPSNRAVPKALKDVIVRIFFLGVEFLKERKNRVSCLVSRPVKNTGRPNDANTKIMEGMRAQRYGLAVYFTLGPCLTQVSS